MWTRRQILTAGAGAAALSLEPSSLLKALPAAASEVGKVKIVDVKTAAVELTYYPARLVKIVTDSELYGLGEAHIGSAIPAHIDRLRELVVGEDPLQVDYLYQKMSETLLYEGSRSGDLSGAIGGIETALWDLAGKILNVPVYVLLGGKFRDRLHIYHDADGSETADPAAWAEAAQRSLGAGFRAIKVSVGGKLDPKRFREREWNKSPLPADLRQWARVLEKIRETVGEDFPFAVDVHWRYNTGDVLRFLQMIEDLNLWFFEDPIAPDDADSFARITAASRTPICTGENLYARQSFRPFIEKRACDIIQPDLQKSGGLLETKKIADWADIYNIPMACHNMCSPVGTIASGHACMAIRSFLTLESDSVDLPYWQDIIQRDGPIYRDGYLEVSDAPGLGVELNEEVCRQHLVPGTGFFE